MSNFKFPVAPISIVGLYIQNHSLTWNSSFMDSKNADNDLGY